MPRLIYPFPDSILVGSNVCFTKGKRREKREESEDTFCNSFYPIIMVLEPEDVTGLGRPSEDN